VAGGPRARQCHARRESGYAGARPECCRTTIRCAQPNARRVRRKPDRRVGNARLDRTGRVKDGEDVMNAVQLGVEPGSMHLLTFGGQGGEPPASPGVL
jgi:hypothetical protein